MVGTALGRPLILENVREKRGHAVRLKLRGAGKNPFAIGARVTVRAGSRSWPVMIHAGSSFMSTSDTRVNVGVGLATEVSVDVHWPSGTWSHIARLATDGDVVTVSEDSHR
ncbi:MAG: hypothetical protein NVS3B20_13890 [Polyangiales bacterium]